MPLTDPLLIDAEITRAIPHYIKGEWPERELVQRGRSVGDPESL